jgi:predicted small lipoprotein YifL
MHCWARYLLYLVIAILAVGQMVTACGQKGDLYLPEKRAETAPPASPLPAPDSPDEGLEALDEVPVVPAGPDTF